MRDEMLFLTGVLKKVSDPIGAEFNIQDLTPLVLMRDEMLFLTGVLKKVSDPIGALAC